MFRDHWPVEKGAVVRHPMTRSLWAMSLLLMASLAWTQDSPSTNSEAEAEPPRRVAGVQWNPKTTPEQIKKFKQQELLQFDPKTRLPVLGPQDEAVLKEHIQNSVYSITVEEEIDNFADIIERKIVLPIERTGTSDAARAFMLDTALKTAEELLEGQPPIVQTNAALLAARLNSKPADVAARPPRPAVPYLPAYKTLLRIARDPSLPIEARIPAVRGLTRILREGDPSNVQRAEIGEQLAAILSEPLNDDVGTVWLRRRVVEALGYTNRLYNVATQPVIIDALLRTLASPQEDWTVRSTAARAITQLPLEASTNIELINHEIGKLAHQLGEAYNATKDRTDSVWRWSFANIYLAYVPATEAEQRNRRWGLKFLSVPRGKAQIDALYQVLIPILKGVIESLDGRPIPDPQLKALADWLAKNKPADRKVTPASKELPEVGASDNKGPTTALPGGATAASPPAAS
jgi:hypothetical protein